MIRLNAAKATIRVSAHLAAMAMPFIAKNDIRYYLNGLAISPSTASGASIMASDGHTAVVLQDEVGRCEKAAILILPPSVRATLRKASFLNHCPAQGTWIEDDDGKTLWISPNEPVDGTFPDLRSTVGPLADYSPGLVGAFNPKLLAKMKDAVGTRKFGMVEFYSRGRNSAALATFGETIKGFALVMPIRDNDGEPTVLARRIPTDFQVEAQPCT